MLIEERVDVNCMYVILACWSTPNYCVKAFKVKHYMCCKSGQCTNMSKTKNHQLLNAEMWSILVIVAFQGKQSGFAASQ